MHWCVSSHIQSMMANASEGLNSFGSGTLAAKHDSMNGCFESHRRIASTASAWMSNTAEATIPRLRDIDRRSSNCEMSTLLS